MLVRSGAKTFLKQDYDSQRFLRGAHHRKVIAAVSAHRCGEAGRERAEQQSDKEPIERVSGGLARMVGGGLITLENVGDTGFGLIVIEAGCGGNEAGDVVSIIRHEHGAVRESMCEDAS